MINQIKAFRSDLRMPRIKSIKFRHSFRVVTFVIAGFLMTGCGGAPSESDIKTTIESGMKAGLDGMAKAGGKSAADMYKSMIPEIKSVKKIGCKDDGEKAYRCDVELEVVSNGATSKNVSNMRFVKASDGWQVTR